MRIGLGPRLFCGFLLVALVGLGSAGVLVDSNVKRVAYDRTADRLRSEVTMTGQMMASAMFAPLTRDDRSLEGPIRELGAAVDAHLSLVAPDGAVVADSVIEAGAALVQDPSAPEVEQAIASGRGESVRGEGSARRLWIAEAVRRDGKLLGVARASVPVAAIDAHVTEVRKRLAVGAAIAMLIAALSALFIAIGIVRPVRRLSTAARKLGEGQLTVRANISRNDEIGDLGDAIDEMAGNIEGLVSTLDERNADMQRVLNTVDQGLLTVDLSGAISAERSARIDTWFHRPVAGAKLWALFPELGVDAAFSFEMGWSQFADDCLPDEVIVDQLPKRVRTGSTTFALRYLPIVDDLRSRRFLVVITDVTAQVAAERVEAVQRDLLRTIDRTQRDRAGVMDFLRETDVLIRRVNDAQASDRDITRDIHTLKGNCGVFGIQSVAACCHTLETRLLAEERSISAAERAELTASWTEVREGVASLLGEKACSFAVSRDQFVDVLGAALSGEAPRLTATKLANWMLTPLDVSFARLRDHAGALAFKLDKQVEVVTDGGGMRLDNERWGGFWAAFVHAVRNAIDHGVELPEERVESGKLPAGQLALRATLENQSFVIELNDDGRGIAWKRVGQQLRERGLSSATTQDLIDGLFMDGLSTADGVTDVSGRGIGMSALRAAVQERGGRVEIRSELGAGTSLRCVFPASAVTVDPAWVLKRELARQLSCAAADALPAAARADFAA
jgi:HAMP domain-containing protein/HPt (histidine-containing phosphotransfer) domain-containing protein